jgi:hypothetical protein
MSNESNKKEQPAKKVTPSANTIAANTALLVSGGVVIGSVIGTLIFPGIGSAIGSLVGGAVGVLGERIVDRTKSVKPPT